MKEPKGEKVSIQLFDSNNETKTFWKFNSVEMHGSGNLDILDNISIYL